MMTSPADWGYRFHLESVTTAHTTVATGDTISLTFAISNAGYGKLMSPFLLELALVPAEDSESGRISLYFLH